MERGRRVLDEIGLTDGEQKVYLSLLRLGETTSGPLAEESRVSASKVYQVVQRLKEKGLAGETLVRGTKHFKATHPRAILDHLQEKRQRIRHLEEQAADILPILAAAYRQTMKETEIRLLQGNESLKNTFSSMIEELGRGETYRILGLDLDLMREHGLEIFFQHHHRLRVMKGVKAQILYKPTGGSTEAFQDAEARTLPQELNTPLQITTHKDTTTLTLMQHEPIIFRIQNQEITERFDQYFDSLWEQARQAKKRGEDTGERSTPPSTRQERARD